MGKTIRVQKRCIYCGRYFKADHRVGNRQIIVLAIGRKHARNKT